MLNSVSSRSSLPFDLEESVFSVKRDKLGPFTDFYLEKRWQNILLLFKYEGMTTLFFLMKIMSVIVTTV